MNSSHSYHCSNSAVHIPEPSTVRLVGILVMLVLIKITLWFASVGG